MSGACLPGDGPARGGASLTRLEVVVPHELGGAGPREHAARGTRDVVMATLAGLVVTFR